MQEQTFQVGDISGVLRKNKWRTPLNNALYYAALAKAYPVLETVKLDDLMVDVPDTSGDANGALLDDDAKEAAQVLAFAGALAKLSPDARIVMALLTPAQSFVRVASYVDEIHGLVWPKPEDVAGVKAAFEWLLDHEDVFDAMIACADTLELPNGVAGKPPELVTEAEQADPLSSSSAGTIERA